MVYPGCMKPFDPLNPPPAFQGMHISRLHARFLVALTRDPAADPIEAAKAAGYKRPYLASKRLTATYGPALARAAQGEGASCDQDELKILLSEVARNRDHKDQVTAIRTLLQMDGAFSEELSEKRTRRELEREVEDLMTQITGRKAPGIPPTRPKVAKRSKQQDTEPVDPEEVIQS